MTMTTPTNQTAAQKAHEKLLDAAGALTMAYDTYQTTEHGSDAEKTAHDNYEKAKASLAGRAISYVRMLEAAAGI